MNLDLEPGQKVFRCPQCNAKAIGTDDTIPGHLCGLETAYGDEAVEFIQYVELEVKRGPGRPRKAEPDE